MKKKDPRKFKPRDTNIIAAFMGEIDLRTKVSGDKTKYKRKPKHKNEDY